MSLHFTEDPVARKKSLMLKQKTCCNGEATGYQCKYYWNLIKKIDVPNPDHIRNGEKLRFCLVDPAEVTDLGEGGVDMAVYCNRFENSSLPYDSSFEVYNPLSPEEVEGLTESDLPSLIAALPAQPIQTRTARFVAALKKVFS